jgi:peptidyl-prolyl cis-trans isomerase B (cyclophilin B)
MTPPRRPGRSRPIRRGATPPTPRPSAPRPGTAAVRPSRPKPGAARRGGGASTPVVVGAVVVLAVIGAAFATGGFGILGGSTASPGASAGPVPTGAIADCPTSQPSALPAGETRTVTISTSKGTIKIKVDGALSPIAAGNFVTLAACGFYDGVVFHRVATLSDGTPFVIQGGDPKGDGSGGPGYSIADEPVTATYHRGTVAMARTSAPNSQGSQFFIVLDDRDASVLSAANTYAIFGEVVEGMDVVDAIYQAAGGVELPPDPIKMDSVTVSAP